MRQGSLWLIVGVGGLVLSIGVGLFRAFGLPPLVRHQVSSTLQLQGNSEAWQRFVKLPIPLTLNLYVFEVLNPDELSLGAKPHLRQRGPYVYQEFLQKQNITRDTAAGTVSYEQNYNIQFSQELSGNLTEDDEVIVLNPIAAGLTTVLDALPTGLSILREIVDSALPVMLSPRPYTTTAKVKVKELLFQGMTLTCNPDGVANATAATLICAAIKDILPIPVIFNQPNGDLLLSILQFKNGTSSGLMKIKDGIVDPDHLGEVVSWNGKTETGAWRGAPCDDVTGYDMTLLPPFRTTSTDFRVFSSDICASARLVYKEPTTYADIPGLRFVPGPEFLADPATDSSQKCFCPASLENLTIPTPCLHKGAIDISGCLSVPAVLSLPHFMDAWEGYSDKFIGLSPDPALHSTFLDVEPLTGVPLQGWRRIQINLRTKPSPAVSVLQNITESLFPIFWLEEGVRLGDDEINMIKNQALFAVNLAHGLLWGIIGIGLAVFVGGGTIGVIRFYLPLF